MYLIIRPCHFSSRAGLSQSIIGDLGEEPPQDICFSFRCTDGATPGAVSRSTVPVSHATVRILCFRVPTGSCPFLLQAVQASTALAVQESCQEPLVRPPGLQCFGCFGFFQQSANTQPGGTGTHWLLGDHGFTMRVPSDVVKKVKLHSALMFRYLAHPVPDHAR